MRRVLLVCLGLVACSDEAPLESPDKEVRLMRRDGAIYFIETYEASRSDATETGVGMDEASKPRSLERRRPWVEVTWAAARAACESKGKRLCERDEWVDACDGVPGEDMGTKYTYGDAIDATICNANTMEPVASGTRTGCRSGAGTFDQSGNVWEWTGNVLATAGARGGGFRSSQVHGCKDELAQEPSQGSTEVGFRCCRD